MSWMHRARRRLRALFSQSELDRDLDDEMRLHLALEAEDLARSGLDRAEAARRAHVAFGGVERHKEDARDGRGVRLPEDFARDLRYAAQGFRRSPGFAVTTVLTLAIGISATTLVFSAVNALFLRRLAVRDPNQLYVVQELWKGGVMGPSDLFQPTYPYEHFIDFADATKSLFTDVAAGTIDVVAVRQGPYARDLTGVVASSNYFSVLGVRPALGRFFSAANERAADAPAEVVIGHDLWQREFNGDSAVIGRTLFADSRALTIVGVVPREFTGTIVGVVAEFWIPAGAYQREFVGDGSRPSNGPRSLHASMFGRLRPGVSLSQALATLAVVAPRLPAEHQMGGQQWIRGVRLDPLRGLPAMAAGPSAGFMAVLMLTAIVVLLIAVANVAGMLLARGAYRRREIAMRLALGASRARLVRQLLTESLLLCGLGAAGGLLFVRWLVAFVPTLQPPVPVRVAFDMRVDTLVLGVTVAVAVFSGVLAGLMPALQSTRMDVLAGLRGASQGRSRRNSRTRDAFVIGQLALSLVLLITAALFTRALGRALRIDPGIDPRGVMTATVDLSEHGYNAERARTFFDQFLARLRARPEVAEVSLGRWTPLGGNNNNQEVYLPGEQGPKGRKTEIGYGVVEAGYLEMMHVKLVAGRSFTTADRAGTPNVIILNETAARRLWPGESPLGRSISVSGVAREVVGIARDGKYSFPDEDPQAYAFIPFAQQSLPFATVFARARGDGAALVGVMRRELAALDPNVALASPTTLSRQIGIYLLPQELAALVVGAFGAVGLLLAVVGVYGVVAYHVGQRTREFGIRLALGAERATLVRLVLRRGLVLIGIAVGIGTLLALGVANLAQRFLFGLGAGDPVTFGVVPLLLAAVATTASYVPARRAARVDPMESLRAE